MKFLFFHFLYRFAVVETDLDYLSEIACPEWIVDINWDFDIGLFPVYRLERPGLDISISETFVLGFCR